MAHSAKPPRFARGVARAALAALGLAALTACGDESATPPPPAAAGFWRGTLTRADGGTLDALVVVPEYDAFLFLLGSDGAPFLAYSGSCSSRGGALSGEFRLFDHSGIYVTSFTGTVVRGATLHLALAGDFLDGSQLDLAFDPAFHRPASHARAAGIWNLGSLAFTVGLDGDLDGSDLDGSDLDGDRYLGSLRPYGDGVNVYRLEFEAYFVGDFDPWYFDGVAIQVDGATRDGALLFTLHGTQYGWFGGTTEWCGRMTR